jgi:SAM-dependent methyltransferase
VADQLAAQLRSVVASYPDELRQASYWVLKYPDLYIERVLFDLDLVRRRVQEGAIVDLGGGYGLFGIAAALAGFRSIVVDDFYHLERLPSGSAAMSLMDRYGVEHVHADLLRDDLQLEAGSIDAVGMFHTFEHLHDSPKRLLHGVAEKLRPGGVFVLGGPNCVNLRKRLTVPLGRGKWTRMDEWYEEPAFRGHVREPDVDDLRYVARDMGLVDAHIVGANFLGIFSRGRLVRILDRPLRLRPSLCSDIYVVASKPTQDAVREMVAPNQGSAQA